MAGDFGDLRREMLADEGFMRGGVAGVKAWREGRYRPLSDVLEDINNPGAKTRLRRLARRLRRWVR